MRRGTYYFLAAVISVLSMGQMIAACGQKGDLYLPQPEPAQQTTADTKTKAVRQAKTDGKAGTKAARVGQESAAHPAESAAGKATAKADPAAASGVEQSGQE